MQKMSLEEVEPSCFLERTVHPGQGNINLASFSWHPTHENRILAISQTGYTFMFNFLWLVNSLSLSFIQMTKEHLILVQFFTTNFVIFNRVIETFSNLNLKKFCSVFSLLVL